MTTDVSFYRTELRVMQLQSVDNEAFLNQAASLISKLNEKLEQIQNRAEIAEHELRLMELGKK